MFLLKEILRNLISYIMIKQNYSKYCVGDIKNINETFDKIFHKKKNRIER